MLKSFGVNTKGTNPSLCEITSLYIYGKVGTGKTVISAYYYVNFLKQLYLQQSFFIDKTYHFVVFSNIKKDAKINKVSIWRGALVVMDMIAKENVPMYAVAHNEKLWKTLGFEKVRGDVYIWRN